MADLIPLFPDFGPETTLVMIRDLERRLTAGEDLGSRSVHIRQLSVALRKTADTLTQILSGLDPNDPVNKQLIKSGHEMIEIAERSLMVAVKTI